MDRSVIFRRKRIGELLTRSRVDAGKTLEDMAEIMCVSRNTISNWERGVGTPDLPELEDWFDALGKDPIKSYLGYKYPDRYDGYNSGIIEEKRKKVADYILNYASPLIVEELEFHFFGDHGSDPDAVMQKSTAYLQIPLNQRQPIASTIYTIYSLVEASDGLNCPDSVRPDKKMLKDAVDSGFDAAANGMSKYSIPSK